MHAARWSLIVCILAGCAGTTGSVQNASTLKQKLDDRGVNPAVSTVLDETVRSRFSRLPFVVVADDKGNFVWRRDGPAPEITREMEQAMWVYRPARGKPLQLWPLKSTAGEPIGWKDLPPAKFYIFEFWKAHCDSCIEQMRQVEAYVADRGKGQWTIVLINCDRFDFVPAPSPVE